MMQTFQCKSDFLHFKFLISAAALQSRKTECTEGEKNCELWSDFGIPSSSRLRLALKAHFLNKTFPLMDLSYFIMFSRIQHSSRNHRESGKRTRFWQVEGFHALLPVPTTLVRMKLNREYIFLCVLNRGKSEKWEEKFFLISSLGWCSLAYFTLMCLSTFLLFPFFFAAVDLSSFAACEYNGKWERFLKTFEFLRAHHSHENEWLRFVLFFMEISRCHEQLVADCGLHLTFL